MRTPLDVMKLNKHCLLNGELSEVGASYGWVRSGGTQAHQGWDLEAEIGTACYAISPGIVVFVRRQDVGSYGRCVLLQVSRDGGAKRSSMPGDHFVFYAHLDKVFVKNGETVAEGAILGETGISGNAASSPSPPHLHFEIRTVSTPFPSGQGPLTNRVDPADVLGSKYLVCTP
jgi:murein DD-endopeptidase MepM/ murein hydrolase activator NlpD